MISGSFIFLVVLILVIFNWQSNLRAKELAFATAKQLCQDQNVQLLDDSVIGYKFGWKNAALIRHYRFDYHTGTNVRYQGYIQISRHHVIDQRLTIKAETLDKKPISSDSGSATVIDLNARRKQNREA